VEEHTTRELVMDSERVTAPALESPDVTARPARPDLQLTRFRKRLLIGALSVGLPLLWLTLDTAWRLADGWRPTPGFDRRVTALVLVAGLAWLAVLAVRPARRAIARRWSALLFVSGLALLAWAALEQAIPTAPFHRRTPGIREVFKPDPRFVPGVSGDGRLSINELGVRGDPLPPRGEAYRILCVGGSTTECLYLDDEETWAHLLQDRLTKAWGAPVWVGNAGISGYATTEHIDFLERFGALSEMDCVVVMAGFNDFALMTFAERGPIRRPWETPGWARSDLFKLVKRGLETAAPGAPFQDPAGRWIEERREVRRPAPKVSTLPELRPSLQRFEQRLEELVALCEGHGVRTVLTNQAVLWRGELPPTAEALLWIGWTRDRRAFYTADALRGGLDAFNARVGEVAARRGVDLVDISAVSGDLDSFYDDCHFTELGARRVAGLVAAQLPPQRPRRKRR
jgi:lysophospholipase L1-like esterase